MTLDEFMAACTERTAEILTSTSLADRNALLAEFANMPGDPAVAGVTLNKWADDVASDALLFTGSTQLRAAIRGVALGGFMMGAASVKESQR